jgi:hypothetical protein
MASIAGNAAVEPRQGIENDWKADDPGVPHSTPAGEKKRTRLTTMPLAHLVSIRLETVISGYIQEIGTGDDLLKDGVPYPLWVDAEVSQNQCGDALVQGRQSEKDVFESDVFVP